MSSPNYCLWPDELSEVIDRNTLVGLAGGKAANLLVLEQVLPGAVPPWFAISTRAFREFYLNIQTSGFENFCEESNENVMQFRQLAARQRLVARSSATLEDLQDSSMAGLFQTVFGISDPPEALLAVRECWESANSEAVKYYCESRALDARGLQMGVVLQAELRPLVAGVLFTADPLTGDTSRCVIESSWGLGVSVVSGSITPDHYVVSVLDKQPTIVDKRISKKRRSVFSHPRGGKSRQRRCRQNYRMRIL